MACFPSTILSERRLPPRRDPVEGLVHQFEVLVAHVGFLLRPRDFRRAIAAFMSRYSRHTSQLREFGVMSNTRLTLWPFLSHHARPSGVAKRSRTVWHAARCAGRAAMYAGIGASKPNFGQTL